MIFVKNVMKQQNKLTAQHIDQIRYFPLFSGLKMADLVGLICNSHYRSFVAGEKLNDEGEQLQYCPLVLEGEVIVFRHTYQGTEKVFALFEPMSIVALAAIFMSHNRFPKMLEAKSNGAAIFLSKEEIIALSEKHALFSSRLLRNFSQQLYRLINELDWVTSSTAEQRLSAYLLDRLAHSTEKETKSLILPLSKSQLAVKLGMRQETLSRLLSRWRKK